MINKLLKYVYLIYKLADIINIDLKWKDDIMSNTFEMIYKVVKQIPKGNVATYGQVAAIAGNKRWARVVGYALHSNPNPDEIPCYRVVNKDGRVSEAFAFGGVNKQIALLKNEGIEFIDEKHVDMEKYQWDMPWY